MDAWKIVSSKRIGIFSLLMSLAWVPQPTGAQTRWFLAEETFVEGVVTGAVLMGHVFRTVSGHYYEVVSPTVEVVVEVMPRMTVLSDGSVYRLIIQGFRDELLAVRLVPVGPHEVRLPGVIESRIDGDFEGYEYGNVYRLRNGQRWAQMSSQYRYRYAFAPEVMIINREGEFALRVHGMDAWVTVKLLRPEGS